MAESLQARRSVLAANPLDIEQILLAAQRRWLLPAEICEILRNYKKFGITPELVNKPPSGSLFLFDRKVLRYFRKDGHKWIKKEAHQRLKVGSIFVLNCYYAHGEENENLQRRCYWILEEEYSHIALVHYLEVLGKEHFSFIQEIEGGSPYSQVSVEHVHDSDIHGSMSSGSHPNNSGVLSENIDKMWVSSAAALETENAQSDIEQAILDSQHRWLCPAEICVILRNYTKFHLSSEPPNTPPSGSLFLFDRKVVPHLRKDGHNWRKKKDGKTVKECHERLKAGGVDVLICYYGHGEGNENFQRRIYWMLEDELSSIVFVHYLEVKGNRSNFNQVRENEAVTTYSKSSRFRPTNCQVPSTTHTADTTSLNSAQALEYQDAEYVSNPQATSVFHSFQELQQPTVEKFDGATSDPDVPQSCSNSFQGKLSVVPGTNLASIQAGEEKSNSDSGLSCESEKHLDFALCEGILENCTLGMESFTEPNTMDQLLSNNFPRRQEFRGQPQVQEEYQVTEKIMHNSEIEGSLSSGSGPNNCLEDTCLNSAQPLERENAQSAIPGIDLAPTQSDKCNDAEATDNSLLEAIKFELLKDDSESCPCSECMEDQSLSSFSYPNTVDEFLNASFVRVLDFKEHSQIPAESKGKSEDIDRVKEAQVACPYSQGQESEEIMSNSKIDSSRCPGSHPNDCQVPSVSEYTNTPLLSDGAQVLERGNAQSEYNYQASSGFHFGSPQLAAEQIHAEDSFLESLPNNFGIESDPFQLNRSNSDLHAELAQPTDDCSWTSHEYTTCKDDGKCFTPCESMELESLSSFGWHSQIQEKSKASVEGSSSLSESACDATSKFHEQEVNHLELMDSVDPLQKRPDLRNNNSKENHFQKSLSNEKDGYVLPLDSDGDSKFEGKLIYSSSIGQHLFNGLSTEEGSKKMCSSGANRETGENENENDVSSIPSEGKLNIQDINAAENYSGSAGANLLLRFDNILWSASSATNSVTSSLEDASQLSSKISSLLKGDNKELDQMLKTGSGTEFSPEKLKDQLLQKHLKEKLRVWILQKKAEGGYGLRVLDEDGQGVLHLAAALGYDWALKPTLDAGVTVDFRDVNGWTALHWAASCGRENTVATLISLGANPGALTGPSPEYYPAITPADLASANGHERIAVYLGKRRSNVLIPLRSSFKSASSEFQRRRAGYMRKKGEFLRREAEFLRRGAECMPREAEFLRREVEFLRQEAEFLRKEAEFSLKKAELTPGESMLLDTAMKRSDAAFLRGEAEFMRREAEFETFLKAQNLGKKMKEDEEEDEGPDDKGPEGRGPEKDEGAEKDEGPGKEKEEGKKRAPDSALEGGKAPKILKAHLACMALLTAYYVLQSMETIQMLVLVWVEASKKTGERKLSYNIDDGFELSAIRE